ncbi:hypothetical protein I315_05676 [Cryptococcus gattii Ru294]|nr:hypothetical protein I315_05676 [Cryptococcus gattii Ru294]
MLLTPNTPITVLSLLESRRSEDASSISLRLLRSPFLPDVSPTVAPRLRSSVSPRVFLISSAHTASEFALYPPPLSHPSSTTLAVCPIS